MKAFFSKRKDGGKSNSDSSLHPPPSSTRRLKQPGADALDLAVDRHAGASSARAEPWDGKCRRCRKLMSRCLCYEDGPAENVAYSPNGNHTIARERTPTNEKRTLFETLSGMHQSRLHSRLPIKTTQDRARERRMKETYPVSSATTNFSSSSSARPFAPTRSPVDPHDEPRDRFTQSCPDVKWRSSAAISSTMRLAHDTEAAPDRKGPPKNLLAYDSKKPSFRAKPSRSVALAQESSTSGNLYIINPLKPGERLDDGNRERVWEL